MNSKESYIFWKLAFSFISDHGYRIIQLFENQKELWLEKIENKKAPIIRILLHNLDWSNAMQRDIEFTAANGERVRKQIGRQQLNVVNIYVSQFPPVDEYEFRLVKPFVYSEGNKTMVSSFLFAQGIFETGFQRISERLGTHFHFTINEEYSEEDVEAVKKATLDYAMKKVKTERAVLMNGKPFFTYVFIAIQIVVFLWLQLHGGSTNTSTLIKYGAKVNQLIVEGEWWRFITPVFLHIGFTHLAMNTLALYFLGTEVERIFGNLRFLWIYMFAGVTGFIASFIFSANLSAGASGAIFGCFGALLYFGVIFPKLFFRTMGMNLIVVLGINLMIGFSATGIDNAGHLGGLVGGFLAAGLVHFPKKKKLWLQLLFFIASGALLWGSLTYGFSSLGKSHDENSNLLMAQEYIKQTNYDKAYNVLKESEEQSVNLSEKTYFLLSFVEIKKGMLSEAKTHLQQAIKLDPSFDEAFFNLALINLEQHDLEEAKGNIEKAIKLKPKQQDYYELLREINRQLQPSGGGE
ncbi:rhomboid family intramembrane serine protease [Neobacillus sp. OS1-33]|uniref:rhomboid family intramembrane serine protease n=1 Tax=Neobacillus sp. OS1-33 TaxID=3070683 RepID=UPI0027DFC1C7|nr:rhomboid family intramembrane serine protease [Neobacillus sp. OS1-33]WML25589.1 rhomboid family intramembrane serine protease [Neobacillus sp. OS1-33]